jgi:peptidoglycan hydrolase FlgJ
MAERSLVTSLPMVAGQTPAPAPNDPRKVHDAAQQFEALLIGQMLRTERESGDGWLGSGGDSAGDCATDYAEQQFATLLAHQGGLGLANMIAAGLTSEQAAIDSNSRPRSSLPAPGPPAPTRD